MNYSRFALTVLVVVFFCSCADSDPPPDGGDLESVGGEQPDGGDAAGLDAGGDVGSPGADGVAGGGDAEVPDVAQTPEVCNGLDDDADGRVDEDIACLCGWDSACYGGPPATRGIGACADGARECDVTGEFWGACEAWVGPGGEDTCDDGIDNDCDGQVDEDCALCDREETCGDGVDNDCNGLIDDGCDLCDVEICGNGADDDCDGAIDEGCGQECAPGLERACFPGLPQRIGVGICATGTQACDDATLDWGDCLGAVTPVEEICDDGLDNNCDGREDEGCQECLAEDLCFDGIDNNCDGQVDEGCGNECAPGERRECFPGPGNPGVGQCTAGEELCNDRGFWGACAGHQTAAVESCEDGVDQDCDGSDLECGPVQVPIFLLGDCVTAACPAATPHPVGCTVFFTPGDDRGCVANRPGEASVYFQAGNSCNHGLVTGTLLCSEEPGAGLNAANCPVNKPQVDYPEDRSGCVPTD